MDIITKSLWLLIGVKQGNISKRREAARRKQKKRRKKDWSKQELSKSGEAEYRNAGKSSLK